MRFKATINCLLILGFQYSIQAFTPFFATKISRSFLNSGITKQQTTPLKLSDDDFMQETAGATRERIDALVKENPVLLFMKGSKIFPQCGFSNTAVQILNTYGIDFHSVDVLSDEAIRTGVKDYSAWPTIPQLYVAGEFVGGSDIMIEMYQNGELAEMIEKAKADMI